MTDMHELSGLPASVRGLTLDLTALAHKTTFAASLLQVEGPGRTYTSEAIVEAWETLTGLSGDAALDAAQAITRHPIPVTAAVVPF